MKVLESFSLQGKTAVVTGGAGLFGRQITQALAEAGATTVLTSRHPEEQRDFIKELEKEGLNVIPFELDQSEEDSIHHLLRSILDLTNRVDVLINNAVARPAKGWTCTAAQFAESMAVNATGIFLMTKVFGEHMAEHGGGSIVNISSIQGMVGPEFSLYEGLPMDVPPDYFFHKGGMIQLTRYAAAKLGPRGVRVNAISPGGLYHNHDPILVERYNARTFLGRMANQTDLKGAVVFLASDASAYITGANLPVDAGYTAK